jgi:hypothetical protein
MRFEIPLWVCMIPTVIVMGAMAYFIMLGILGEIVANKIFPQLVVLFAIVGVLMLLSYFLPDQATVTMRNLLELATFPMILFVFLFHWRAVMNAGAVLLDLGRMRGYRFALVTSIGVFIVGLVEWVSGLVEPAASGVAFHDGTGTRLSDSLDGLASMAISLMLGLMFWRRVQLRERGLVHGLLFRWEKIKGYHWVHGDPTVLTLRVRRLIPIFQEIPIPVPADRVGAVDAILSQHVVSDVRPTVS